MTATIDPVIDLPMHHPHFDMDMEVLACLPRLPASVAMSDLANDFGFVGHKDLRAAIARLRERGYEIEIGRFQDGVPGNRVGVTFASWPKVKRDCNAYFKRTGQFQEGGGS